MTIFFAILPAPSIFSGSGRDFLGKFLATDGFPSHVSRMGFVPGYEENPLESLLILAMG